jgi:hypothetical protein
MIKDTLNKEYAEIDISQLNKDDLKSLVDIYKIHSLYIPLNTKKVNKKIEDLNKDQNIQLTKDDLTSLIEKVIDDKLSSMMKKHLDKYVSEDAIERYNNKNIKTPLDEPLIYFYF